MAAFFFLFIAVTSLNNSITVAAGAAAACAFFVFTILIVVSQGFDALHKRQDEQINELMEANRYLKYLAQRERDRLKP